jgi:hypothetical protein
MVHVEHRIRIVIVMTGRYVNFVHITQRFDFVAVHIEPFVKHINHRFTGGNMIERRVLVTWQSVLTVVERVITRNVFFEYPVFDNVHIVVKMSEFCLQNIVEWDDHLVYPIFIFIPS